MAYRYQGDSNQELVETLEEDGIFSSTKVKEAMLAVSRGIFVPSDLMDEAFIDRPLRTELGFNISAPHMYAFCLQALDIRPEHTFLDVGSGCGHMTALGGYLVGPSGKSHGIDILEEAVSLSKNSLKILIQQGLSLHNVSYEKRNVFIADFENRRWDRIHVGASCPHKEKHRLYELLNPGGILVMPIGSIFIKAEKDNKGLTKETKLLDVRYGELLLPTPSEIAEAERLRSLQVILPESSINQDYCKMFNNPFLSDVKFLVEGKPLYGHKAILASRSEYFSSLYNSGMREASSSEMVISNYSYEAFLELLRFIYTDQCQVNPTLAAELMGAAEFYRLTRLKAITEYTLSKAIDIDTACPILEIAHSFGAKQLKLLVHEYIFQNYEHIAKTNLFSEMNKECLTEILHVAFQKMQQVKIP